MPLALEGIKTLLPPSPCRKNQQKITSGIRKVNSEKSRDPKGSKKNWAQQWFELSCVAVSLGCSSHDLCWHPAYYWTIGLCQLFHLSAQVGTCHSRSTIKMCLMNAIERKRETDRCPNHRESGTGGPYRSHFKHNGETILIESLKYHHVCWVENVWEEGEENGHRFARVQMRGYQVRGAGTERSRFNK